MNPIKMLLLLVLLLASATAPVAAQEPEFELDVHWVPTPHVVVERMLQLANVGPDDVVYDLGCGDGRLVITAAQKFGARGVGIDIDPARIEESRQNARNAGVDDRVQFRKEDLFEADISEATVVTLYLLGRLNVRLRPKLLKELRPGTRIVSHAFSMGDWEPQEEISVDGARVFLWTVPEEPLSFSE
jgi:SAM-dependent methyltransferase